MIYNKEKRKHQTYIVVVAGDFVSLQVDICIDEPREVSRQEIIKKAQDHILEELKCIDGDWLNEDKFEIEHFNS